MLLPLAVSVPVTSYAGQEIYLSNSPNGRYRVIVEQVIDRRVGDRVFFRYPLLLENTKDLRRHFEMMDGGSALIQETDNQTFKVDFDAVRFDWAKDSLKFFVHLQTIPGTWKTYFVNINTGKALDVTEDIEAGLYKKVEGWGCQQPKVELVKWVKPHLAFLKLTSICGKDNDQENKKLFYERDSVLFDTTLGQVVSHCLECKDDGATKKFEKYYLSTIPTPTPTPEETPTAQ